MWPFSKKWNPPTPRLGMVISITSQELPSLVALANPSGAEGAVTGMLGPTDGKPTAEKMMQPIQEGHYVGISPGGGICGVQVEPGDPQAEGLSLPPEMLEASGLNEDMLAKF